MKLQAFCIAALFALAPVATAQAITPPPTQASYDLLEELAGRIIGYGYDEPELMVGKLPGDRIKLEIPVPDGARVLGTSVSNGENYEVVMDIRGDGKAILDFYRAKLKDFTDKGSQSDARGGFLYTSSLEEGRPYSLDTLLCQDQWSVSVIIHRLDAAIKDVRLRINRYTCLYSQGGIVLPNLLMPKSAEPTSGSSGYGDDVSSSITINTDLNLSALFDHYNSQLEQANWKQSEKIALKNGLVVTYTFNSPKNEPWGALLTIVPAKGGLFTASIHAYPL